MSPGPGRGQGGPHPCPEERRYEHHAFAVHQGPIAERRNGVYAAPVGPVYGRPYCRNSLLVKIRGRQPEHTVQNNPRAIAQRTILRWPDEHSVMNERCSSGPAGPYIGLQRIQRMWLPWTQERFGMPCMKIGAIVRRTRTEEPPSPTMMNDRRVHSLDAVNERRDLVPLTWKLSGAIQVHLTGLAAFRNTVDTAIPLEKVRV